MNKTKILFMGTPDFSIPTLEMLFYHPKVDLLGVVTMPDRPKGRGRHLQAPPVADFAKTHKIPLFQTENLNNDTDILNTLESLKADAIIVLAFAQFLGKKVLSMTRLGAFNIHTSILPKYRGAAPIQYALKNGDTTTGVSIQKMVKKMDAGDITHFESINISINDNWASLSTKLKFKAAILLDTFINDLTENNLIYTSQDEEQITFSPTIKKEDGLVNFKTQTAEEIYNLLRAFTPWPGIFTILNGKRLKIHELEILDTPIDSLKPGNVDISNGKFIICTKYGLLRLLTVQLESKNKVKDIQFINGLKGVSISFD